MADDRSRGKLLEFLGYLAEKGLMDKATASARKASAGKLLGILEEQEAQDVTKLDLDDVMRRFNNLEGKNYTPGSLSAYLSRTRSAVDDFRSYLENPLAFRPGVQRREKKKSDAKREAPTSAAGHTEDTRTSPRTPISNTILPIQIRHDTTVYVQGLPFDLTEAEANKIANVIRAMATPAL